MFKRLKSASRRLRRNLAVYRLAMRDPRTPRAARWLLRLAVAYAVSPIDLIPDFIPVLGYLDDVVILPALVALAVWMIPKEVLAECRAKAKASAESRPSEAADPDGEDQQAK